MSKLLMPQLRKRVIDYRIDFLARYSESLEEMLQREAKLFGESLDRRASGLSEDERDEFLSNYAEEYQELASHFPNQLRYGLVIAAYGLLEEEFLATAKILQASRKIQLRLSDLQGDGIGRAWVFVTKVAGMPLPPHLWESIQPYRLLRNVIVHSGGQVSTEGKQAKTLSDFISRSPNLQIDSQRYVVVSDAFAEEFLSKIKSFYAELSKCWAQWLEIKPVSGKGNS